MAIRKILKKHDKQSSVQLVAALRPYVEQRAFSSLALVDELLRSAHALLADLASSHEQRAAAEGAAAAGAAVGAEGAPAAASIGTCPSDGGHMVSAPPPSVVRQVSVASADTDSAKTDADGGSGSTDTAATLSCDGGAGAPGGGVGGGGVGGGGVGGGAGAADGAAGGAADGVADGAAAVALARAAAAAGVKEDGSSPPHPSPASSAAPRQVSLVSEW